jgi:hypothetical protein
MSRLYNIDQRLDQIEHLYEFRIIEPPHNILRSQFDIGCTVLPRDAMLDCIEFEARRPIVMCRSHRRLKHAHPIPIRTYENHIIAAVKI